MKGQVSVLEEMLVFGISLIVMINLVVLYKTVENSVKSATATKLLDAHGEMWAAAITKAYLTGGNYTLAIDNSIGERSYSVSLGAGGVVLTTGSEYSAIPLFGIERVVPELVVRQTPYFVISLA